MSVDRWHPHVTVAAVVERGERFLIVDERTEEGRRLNQPAGHWEPGETLLDAAIRETREETGLRFRPEALVAVYEWSAPGGPTYLRFTFCGTVSGEIGPSAPEIVEVLWMTPEELRRSSERHRGPQVLRAIEDYRAGHRHPVGLVRRLVGGSD